jgi:hypothetical protein
VSKVDVSNGLIFSVHSILKKFWKSLFFLNCRFHLRILCGSYLLLIIVLNSTLVIRPIIHVKAGMSRYITQNVAMFCVAKA